MMRAVTALAHMLSWYNAVVDTAVVDNTAQLSHILVSQFSLAGT